MSFGAETETHIQSITTALRVIYIKRQRETLTLTLS